MIKLQCRHIVKLNTHHDRTRNWTKMKRCCRSYNPLVTEGSSDTQARPMWSNAYLDRRRGWKCFNVSLLFTMLSHVWKHLIWKRVSIFPCGFLVLSRRFPVLPRHCRTETQRDAGLCGGSQISSFDQEVRDLRKTKSMRCVNKKNEVWSTMFSTVLFSYMFNKMPLKSLENAEIKLEEFERSEKKNKLVFEKEQYDSVWQHEIPCPILSHQVKIHRPRSACKVSSNPSEIQRFGFLFSSLIGLLILGGPGKSPLGGEWWQVRVGGWKFSIAIVVLVVVVVVVVTGGCGCGRRLLYCLVSGCMVWKPMVTTCHNALPLWDSVQDSVTG